jgi:phosphomevalonate kinase
MRTNGSWLLARDNRAVSKVLQREKYKEIGRELLIMITAVSAPGKVLLAGGYLVLDRAYTALVFGLSARIHVVVQDVDLSSGNAFPEIVVESPQFRDALWRYRYTISEVTDSIEVTQLQE